MRRRAAVPTRSIWLTPPIRLCLLGAACLGAAPGAQAQDIGVPDIASGGTAISVQKRARPDFDPVPVRFGTFEASAFAEAAIGYDDNVYAAAARSGNKVGDALGILRAGGSIGSAWSRHALALNLGGGVTRGASQHGEDTQVYDTRLDGRLDIGTRGRLSAHAGYAHAYEPRGSIGDTALRGPRIAYDTVNLGTQLQYTPGRLIFAAQAGLETFRYAPYRAGGVTIARGDRDYRAWSAGLNAGYAIAPGIAAVVEGGYNAARYPEDTAPLDRTSSGWSLRGGVAFGVTRLIRGRAAIGWQDQRYDDPAFPRIRGLDFNAALEWNPTRLMTWTLEARRTIQRSPLVGVAGIRQSRYGARLDYEALRALIVWSRIDRTVNAYAGTDLSQNDWSGGLGADWLLGRRLRLSVQGTAQRTRSDAPGGRAFDRRRVSMSVRYAL